MTAPPVAASLKEAGPEGLLCRAAEPLPELARVEIAIELPGSGSPDAPRSAVALSGVVVACEPREHDYEIALQLEGLPPGARRRLAALLEPAGAR